MSGTLDSEAVLRTRASAIGVTPGHIDQMVAAGYSSLGRFAFACNFVPGGADDAEFVALVATITGAAPPSPAALACFRRLFFEAYTLAAADLRPKVSRDEDSAPRRLAAPERSHRYQEQQARLVGLRLVGELEPADSLVDAACQMAEDGRLQFIDWSACVKKEQELVAGKKEALFKTDSAGTLRLATATQDLQADLSTDLLIRFSLQRRALAMEQARLMSFARQDAWIDLLFAHRLRVPPPGYAPVGLGQLHNADKTLFARMAETCRTGIAARADGTLPLDDALQLAMVDASVVFQLMPLPLGGKGVPDRVPQDATPEKRKPEPAHPKAPPDTPAKRVKGDKPKGGGKGKGGNVIKVLKALAGMHSRTADGTPPPCYGFNLGNCPNTVTNGACVKGAHLCCRPGCYKDHSYLQH